MSRPITPGTSSPQPQQPLGGMSNLLTPSSYSPQVWHTLPSLELPPPAIPPPPVTPLQTPARKTIIEPLVVDLEQNMFNMLQELTEKAENVMGVLTPIDEAAIDIIGDAVDDAFELLLKTPHMATPLAALDQTIAHLRQVVGAVAWHTCARRKRVTSATDLVGSSTTYSAQTELLSKLAKALGTSPGFILSRMEYLHQQGILNSAEPRATRVYVMP